MGTDFVIFNNPFSGIAEKVPPKYQMELIVL